MHFIGAHAASRKASVSMDERAPPARCMHVTNAPPWLAIKQSLVADVFVSELLYGRQARPRDEDARRGRPARPQRWPVELVASARICAKLLMRGVLEGCGGWGVRGRSRSRLGEACTRVFGTITVCAVYWQMRSAARA